MIYLYYLNISLNIAIFVEQINLFNLSKNKIIFVPLKTYIYDIYIIGFFYIYKINI
jgi:hypothetical protein